MSRDYEIIVLDTNVLVSGLLNPHGPPGRIVEWLRSGVLQAGVDDRIVAEYEEVLRRPKLGLPQHEVRIVLRHIDYLAEHAIVMPQHTVQGLPDPDDAPFVECARALGCALVTGNKRHFPRSAVEKLRVLSARQFCDIITVD